MVLPSFRARLGVPRGLLGADPLPTLPGFAVTSPARQARIHSDRLAAAQERVAEARAKVRASEIELADRIEELRAARERLDRVLAITIPEQRNA